MRQKFARPLLPLARLPLRRRHAALFAVVSLAALLYTYRLDQAGFGNEYYAAASLSMSRDIKAFFFGSLDTANFITIDKPAPGLWLNALSVKVFGLTPWGLLLPQVAASLGSVLVLYATVSRRFGAATGLAAALALAVMPATVATTRANLPDALLVFLLLCSAWATSRAIEDGRLRWALLAALFVGLAFNVKMLQAYIVLPALALAFAVAAPLRWKAKAGQFALAAVVLVAVSASWAAAVDLWPPDSRPYIGGSEDNTVRGLALGYNGLGRIFGNERGARQTPSANAPAPTFGGSPGWGRLFNDQVGGEIAWLLPFAAVGAVAGLAARGRSPLSDPRRGDILLWSGWSAAHVIVFSQAEGIFHPYYTSALAPAFAALVAIGALAMLQALAAARWQALFLPLALALTAWAQVQTLRSAPGWNEWLPGTVLLLSAAAGLTYVASRSLPPRLLPATLARAGSVALAVAAVLLAPALWSAATLAEPRSGTDPRAGPVAAAVPPGAGAAAARPPGLAQASPATRASARRANAGLLAYLEANRGRERWLVAVYGAAQASPLILASSEPVMAFGGFSGGDPAPTPARLAQLVAGGQLRFVMSAPGRGPGAELRAWVQANCRPVDPSLYLTSVVTPPAGPSGTRPPAAPVFAGSSGGVGGFLYDCASAPSRSP